jgi:hypothetical protein
VLERQRGMSILELSLATALCLMIAASIFAIVNAGSSASIKEPETADMQQRLRVAAETLTTSLASAGAGSYLGGQSVALVYAFPPVLPFRLGTVADPAGTFRADALTLISVPITSAQTILRADVSSGADALPVVPQPHCPTGTNLCGFAAGMPLLMYDDSGNFDTFTVAAVADGAAEVLITPRSRESSATIYRAGSTVVEAELESYYLKVDAVTRIGQLMRDDGSGGVPVVDHVVGLRFEYYGEPLPPALTSSGSTYGPSPPPVDVRTPPYAPGENCLFAVEGNTDLRFARIPSLGAGDALTTLTAAQLNDGPWCPDALNRNRWDADLLRIRSVGVTLRVEAALAALRGPAGLLFANAGTSRGGAMWAPDLEMRFQVTPRNLSVSR